MRRALGVLIAFVALMAAGVAGAAIQAVQAPPRAYQGDNRAQLVFMSGGVDAHCRAIGAQARADWVVLACTRRGVIYAPNPCLQDESYARLLCHELAHVNGWPSDHPVRAPRRP